MLRRPPHASVDGLDLSRFEPGCLYDVGTSLGCLFLAEDWAAPVTNEDPALLVPLADTRPSTDVLSDDLPNLVREMWPPYLDDLAVVPDLERRKRRRR